MRLIDADEFCKKYDHFGLQNGSCVGRHSGMAEFLLDELKKAQTIEAEPVIHGRWEPLGRLSEHRCSSCKKVVYVPFYGRRPLYKYCANCGAKMDLEVDHGKEG